MKKDEIVDKMRYLNKYILNTNEIVEGMYVGKFNYHNEKIENKYIVVSNTRTNMYDIRISCYDFIENKIVDFYAPDAFGLLRVSPKYDAGYRFDFKYSTLDDNKKINIGEKVIFVNYKNSRARPTPIFTITRKQKIKIQGVECLCFDLISSGYKLYNVPGTLLRRIFSKEDIEKEINHPKYSISEIKIPKKFKFGINIYFRDDTPVEIELNYGNDPSSKKILMYASLEDKIKFSDTIKDTFKYLYSEAIKKEEKVFELVNGKTKYWRFSPFNFKHIEEKIYYDDDLDCQADFKSGNIFRSKEEIIKNSVEENTKKIKEKLAKFILEN